VFLLRIPKMSIAKHPLRKTVSPQVADEIRPSADRELNNSSGVYSHDLRKENWILVRESCAMSSASFSRPLLYGTSGRTSRDLFTRYKAAEWWTPVFYLYLVGLYTTTYY